MKASIGAKLFWANPPFHSPIRRRGRAWTTTIKENHINEIEKCYHFFFAFQGNKKRPEEDPTRIFTSPTSTPTPRNVARQAKRPSLSCCCSCRRRAVTHAALFGFFFVFFCFFFVFLRRWKSRRGCGTMEPSLRLIMHQVALFNKVVKYGSTGVATPFIFCRRRRHRLGAGRASSAAIRSAD